MTAEEGKSVEKKNRLGRGLTVESRSNSKEENGLSCQQRRLPLPPFCQTLATFAVSSVV